MKLQKRRQSTNVEDKRDPFSQALDNFLLDRDREMARQKKQERLVKKGDRVVQTRRRIKPYT